MKPEGAERGGKRGKLEGLWAACAQTHIDKLDLLAFYIWAEKALTGITMTHLEMRRRRREEERRLVQRTRDLDTSVRIRY